MDRKLPYKIHVNIKRKIVAFAGVQAQDDVIPGHGSNSGTKPFCQFTKHLIDRLKEKLNETIWSLKPIEPFTAEDWFKNYATTKIQSIQRTYKFISQFRTAIRIFIITCHTPLFR